MLVTAEAAHEKGRQGAIRAKHVLWQILGPGVDLPFNAYDHREKVTFADDPDGTFSFDLAGILRSKNSATFAGEDAVEVFVEVKSVSEGSALLPQYKDFLRRAALASADERHRSTWFIFLATVPFGTSHGSKLCDGSLLQECARDWPKRLQDAAVSLSDRMCLLIVTGSFERVLRKWGRRD